MQGTYAHYHFGCQALKSLPQSQQRKIQRFPQMYTMGTYGPDIFYFQKPMQKGSSQADLIHDMTGEEFFIRCCRVLKDNPSEAGLAYVYGLLSHYCLDSACRDFIAGNLHKDLNQREIGVEFDRFLLTRQGKTPAHTQDTSGPMKLTPGECQTVSHFYPPATAGQISAAVGNMRRITRWLAGKSRKTLVSLCPALRDRLMANPANHKCLHLNEDLLVCYNAGLCRYPELARQLSAYLEEGTPLGEAFRGKFF